MVNDILNKRKTSQVQRKQITPINVCFLKKILIVKHEWVPVYIKIDICSFKKANKTLMFDFCKKAFDIQTCISTHVHEDTKSLGYI